MALALAQHDARNIAQGIAQLLQPLIVELLRLSTETPPGTSPISAVSVLVAVRVFDIAVGAAIDDDRWRPRPRPARARALPVRKRRRHRTRQCGWNGSERT